MRSIKLNDSDFKTLRKVLFVHTEYKSHGGKNIHKERLAELATNAGAHEFLVLAVTMISNFVLEYLYCRFIVYRNSCDTAVKNDQETKTIVEDNNGKEEKE